MPRNYGVKIMQLTPISKRAPTSTPRVSVGMPVFNGENYLEKAIEAVLAQTFDNLELVISDNASTDGTPDICRRYVHMDSRVRYLRNESNVGAALNYNYAFRHSRGEYFKWAAHDDIILPTFLERCIEILDASPEVVLCFSRATIISADGNTIERVENNPKIRFHQDLDLRIPKPHQRLYRLIKNMGLCHPIYGVIRSSVLTHTRLIDGFVSSDVVLLCELAMQGQFCQLSDPLFARRLHSNLSSWNKSPKDVAEWFDPNNKSKFVMKRNRILIEQALSVSRSPIQWVDRLRCFGVLLWSLWYAKRRIFREWVGAIRRFW